MSKKISGLKTESMSSVFGSDSGSVLFTITIPDVPPSLNALPRHWAAKRDLRYNWVLYIRAALPAGKHKATVKMRCTITLHHARMYDADNAYGACKILIDALRNRNVIVDDTAEWLELSVEQTQCPHKERHTVIEIGAAA